MNILQISVATLILVFTIAGCAQKSLPPPYPTEERGPTVPEIPQQTTETIDEQDASTQVKTVPQPIGLPDIGGVETEISIQDPKARPFSAGFVNDRILVYQKKLERWKQLDQQSTVATMDQQQTQSMVACFRDLQGVLNGYEKLHNQIFNKDSISTMDRLSQEHIIALQRQDIDFLEGRCGTLLSETGTEAVSPQAAAGSGSLALSEQLMAEHYQNHAYNEVVEAWSQIPAYQQEMVNRQTALYYANALIYLDQLAKATEVYQQIIDKMPGPEEPADDLLSLRRTLGDLYAASGNFFAAQGQYEKLAADYAKIGRLDDWAQLQLTMFERSMKGGPELTDFSNLLRAYLKFSPENDGYSVVWKAEQFLQQYPYSPVSPNVDIIKEETMGAADRWLSELLAEADKLVDEKRIDEAITLLQGVDEQKLRPENLLELKEKLDALVLAEAVERETLKIEKMQVLQTTWNEAAARADAGDLDGAIAIFTELLGSEYDTRAREQISELSLTAAKAERKKAADLFVRATKTDDIAARKDLLVQSRQVLKEILTKYPDAEVADKVEGNIQTVEKKINELDPTLLPELEERERQEARLQQSESNQQGEIDAFDKAAADQTRQPGQDHTVLPVYTPQNQQ